jgi:hypothetical protein
VIVFLHYACCPFRFVTLVENLIDFLWKGVLKTLFACANGVSGVMAFACLSVRETAVSRLSAENKPNIPIKLVVSQGRAI